MAKAGADFELLVKSIYEEILEKDGFETIQVSHDVKVLGKSGQAHQIDVYWEFKIAGITHRVAVECKEYTSSVSVGKIRDFHGALFDIGNIKGIFVTTKGYQQGAITFAESVGIDLKTVSEPSQEELDELPGINTLEINGRVICIGKSEVSPIFDMAWIKENTDFKHGDIFSFNGMNNEISVVDSNGEKLHSILDLQNQLPRVNEAAKDLTYTYQFDDGYFFAPNSGIQPLKLKAVKFIYDVYIIDTSNTIRFRTMAKAILKDIFSGDYFLHKEESHIE